MRLAGDPGFAAVQRELEGVGLPALEMYKEKCLARRLAVRMRACGVHTLDDYARVLAQAPEEVERLLATLTINVTQFFRNPESWDALARTLKPLVASRRSSVRAWSAGCASGEEPYTLSMLLSELLAGTPPPPALSIDATDIDHECLARASAARYARTAFGAPLPTRALPWLRLGEDGMAEVRPEVRERVRFLRHDLGQDPPPSPPYDLIICRNVLIYFDRAVQERLYRQFVDALVPGGLLLLGKVETLFGPTRDRLEMVDLRERLYRRIP